jgi:transcriptional regulator GlxA family with amidase domain
MLICNPPDRNGRTSGRLLFCGGTYQIAHHAVLRREAKSSKFYATKRLNTAIYNGNGGRVLFGILIYDGVEPIDLATYGVLSMAQRVRPEIELCAVAPRAGVTKLANGLGVIADYDFATAPPLDVLIVTGGPGWVQQARSAETLAFIRDRAAKILVVSVCTGGMILAASGVLDGKSATTKREVTPPEISPLARLRAEYPNITACEASLVDDETVITGGGVALCIDTTLHLLKKIFGPDVAAETARIIEYQRAWAANLEQFPPLLISKS